jgi:hypothetical protein
MVMPHTSMVSLGYSRKEHLEEADHVQWIIFRYKEYAKPVVHGGT